MDAPRQSSVAVGLAGSDVVTGLKKNYALLSAFLFLYFFAQAMSISLLALWLKSTLGLTGAQTGIVFSANFIFAMCSQPIYGFLSDKVGFKKTILWLIAVLVMLSGGFFAFVYGPLLKINILAGAAIGGAYLGVTFIAGGYALESYVDRVGRKDGFEYSRARLWGSLGFAFAAFFSGRLYNIDPLINFSLASVAGLLLLPILAMIRVSASTEEQTRSESLKPLDALAILKMPKFWGFMVLILGVTNLYLVYDQQFPAYYASQFADPKQGAAMFGYLNSAQIFVEAGMLFVAPVIVNRTGAKNGLLLAAAIMIVRIAGSGLVEGPLAISAMKMLHSLELPILAVSIFRYIAAHFETRLASTLYLVGVSFGHSLGLAILSPIVGKSYDLIGFPHTYLLIALGAALFWTASLFSLSPTPVERGGAGDRLLKTPLPDADLAKAD
jgi:OHS family lactose permease-like MFS transporter